MGALGMGLGSRPANRWPRDARGTDDVVIMAICRVDNRSGVRIGAWGVRWRVLSKRIFGGA